MEEQKFECKEVKMTPVVNDKASNQGDSLIEELQKWDKDKLIQQVIQMNQQLYNQYNYIKTLRNQIVEIHQLISNKRMEYLFKVVETANQSNCKYDFDPDFVLSCVSEIQEALTIPTEENSGEPSESGIGRYTQNAKNTYFIVVGLGITRF